MKGRCLGAGGTENHDKTKTEIDPTIDRFGSRMDSLERRLSGAPAIRPELCGAAGGDSGDAACGKWDAGV